jgi:hypothetical protein
MNFKKLGVLAVFALLATFAFTTPAAAQRPGPDLSANNWRVFNIDNSVPKLWDINKADALSTGGVQFPFQTSTTAGPWDGTGWFSAYLKTNYNRDLTGKLISATVTVFAAPGTAFWTRSSTCANTGIDAYVRLEFQSATGNYDASDYWWSTGANSLRLSAIANSGPQVLSFSTADPSAWSNIDGQTGLQNPAGFAAALKNVKEIGVAFGSTCRYASGVNVSGGTALFQLNSYTVSP